MAREFYKFKNGATLIYNFEKETAKSNFVVTFKGGHNSEPIGGLAHFCEHLAFLGGKYKEKTDIKLEELTTFANAYTYPQKTSFIIRAENKNFFKASNLILDNLLKFNFSKEEFDREKEIVKIEILQSEQEYENTEEVLGNENDEEDSQTDGYALYADAPNDFPYGIEYPNIEIKHLSKYLDPATRDDAKDFAKENYAADNMVVCVSTSFPIETVIEKLQPLVEKFKSGTSYTYEVAFLRGGKQTINVEAEKDYKTAEIKFEFMNRQNFFENSNFAYVLDSVLNGVSGALYQEFRVKNPCCYTPSYTNTKIADNFINHEIYLTTTNKNCGFVADRLMHIIADLKTNGITKAQYATIKKRLEKEEDVLLRTEDLETITDAYFYEGETYGYSKEGISNLSYEKLNARFKESLNSIAFNLNISAESSVARDINIESLANILCQEPQSFYKSYSANMKTPENDQSLQNLVDKTKQTQTEQENNEEELEK